MPSSDNQNKGESDSVTIFNHAQGRKKSVKWLTGKEHLRQNKYLNLDIEILGIECSWHSKWTNE